MTLRALLLVTAFLGTALAQAEEPRDVEALIADLGDSDPSLREHAMQQLLDRTSALPARVAGELIESGEVIATRPQKEALFASSKALAADMESATLAEFAYQRKLPFVAIRAIADTATDEVPRAVLNNLGPSGSINLTGLIRSAFLRPGDWMPFLRLIRGYRHALRSLRAVASVLRIDEFPETEPAPASGRPN